MQIQYGLWLNNPVVTLGDELAKGETGHIEYPYDTDRVRGVANTYFFYRAQTNGSGYLGTDWLVTAD